MVNVILYYIGDSRFFQSSIFSNVDSSDQHNSNECEECAEELWNTSVGKFRFSIEDLPPQLQYLHILLKVHFNYFYVFPRNT